MICKNILPNISCAVFYLNVVKTEKYASLIYILYLRSVVIDDTYLHESSFSMLNSLNTIFILLPLKFSLKLYFKLHKCYLF